MLLYTFFAINYRKKPIAILTFAAHYFITKIFEYV